MDKHGITVDVYQSEIWRHTYTQSSTVHFAGTDSTADRVNTPTPDQMTVDPKEPFEIEAFQFKTYTRQVNHIVAYLDRITVWDRVRKDDLTVMDLMPGFTLAQITEFIIAAQEANAVNVLAALLEYKNANFSDFDPMDEFTLEW